MAKDFKKYLMGFSALLFWKVPDLFGNLLTPGAPIHPEFLVFVEKGQSLYTPKGYNLSTSSNEGAKKWLVDNVCRPELAFVQACKTLNKWDAILLGLQLCAHYPNNGTPICTPESLKACVADLGYYPGVVMARWALQYIREGSLSVFESKKYMRWALPACHGGFGVRNFVMNRPVEGESGHPYKLDFSVPGKMLDLEYNGREFHKGDKAKKKDTARRKDLEAAGYTVISCIYEDMTDLGRLEQKAREVFFVLNRKIRIRAMKFFHGFWMIQDRIEQKFSSIRDHYTRVERVVFSSFPGSKKSYARYLKHRAEQKEQLLVDFLIGEKISFLTAPC